MLRRIHVYAASLGLLLAGPAVAADQSSEAVMLDTASAAAAKPTFELMGFPITRHQIALLGAAQIRERSPTPTLALAGMPASPHQVAVLTAHSRSTGEPTTNKTVSFSTR